MQTMQMDEGGSADELGTSALLPASLPGGGSCSCTASSVVLLARLSNGVTLRSSETRGDGHGEAKDEEALEQVEPGVEGREAAASSLFFAFLPLALLFLRFLLSALAAWSASSSSSSARSDAIASSAWDAASACFWPMRWSNFVASFVSPWSSPQ